MSNPSPGSVPPDGAPARLKLLSLEERASIAKTIRDSRGFLDITWDNDAADEGFIRYEATLCAVESERDALRAENAELRRNARELHSLAINVHRNDEAWELVERITEQARASSPDRDRP